MSYQFESLDQVTELLTWMASRNARKERDSVGPGWRFRSKQRNNACDVVDQVKPESPRNLWSVDEY